MVPVDGDVREGVGLLGSPSFEIPRSVERDSRFDHLTSGDGLRRRLAAKNRHNAVTIALFLLVRWIHLLGVTMLMAGAADLYAAFGASVIVLANVGILLFTVGYFVLVERAATGFRALRPLYCSIYELRFWRHERFWKAAATSYIQAFNGTPFKNAIWRLLGVRLGRRVFDDGCGMPEKTLVTIGDDCTLNAGIGHPVPLPGGRHLQVRPHHDRCRLHPRDRRLGPLRRDDGRRRGARPRLLPHEGRGRPRARQLGRKSGQRASDRTSATGTTAASSWPR